MNTEFFIAKRIHFRQKGNKSVSRPAVQIATIGIAVGLAVMLVAVAIVTGFKKEIREKVIGFGSHIQIGSFKNNNTYETSPIVFEAPFVENISNIEGIRHIQRFATKPGIIKTETDFQGIVLKGIDEHFNWDFFSSNMLEGSRLTLNPDSSASNEVVISKTISDLLKLKVGDAFITYFIQEHIKARKFTVKGIYSTDFGDFDKLFVITDIRHVQRLNEWESDEISGLEILIDNYNDIDFLAYSVYEKTANRFDRNGASYYAQSIKDLNPQIFGWLDLLDMNVILILALMSIVAGFNMISGLLILILERTNMIGILKAMGSNNWFVRKIFLYQSVFLIGKGILWGNIIGLIICIVQQQFGLIKLDPEIYYVSSVPINLNAVYWILLNIGSFLISMLMLIGPSYLITNIKPSKAIRFE